MPPIDNAAEAEQVISVISLTIHIVFIWNFQIGKDYVYYEGISQIEWTKWLRTHVTTRNFYLAKKNKIKLLVKMSCPQSNQMQVKSYTMSDGSHSSYFHHLLSNQNHVPAQLLGQYWYLLTSVKFNLQLLTFVYFQTLSNKNRIAIWSLEFLSI